MFEWLERIRNDGSNGLREFVMPQIAEATSRGVGRDFTQPTGPNQFTALAKELLTPAASDVFFQTGLDPLNTVCEACNLERGWRLRAALRSRVGEEMPERPNFEHLLSAARGQLGRD